MDADDLPALQAQVIRFAVHLAGLPDEIGGEEIDGIFNRAQGNRPPGAIITAADRRLLFCSTLRRAIELVEAAEAQT
jgi:hypothetical protein